MLLSKCPVSDSKKTKFVKQWKAGGLLSSLGIKPPIIKIPLGPLLFQKYQQVNTRYKMNETVNKILLAGDKLKPGMHLKQPGLTYSSREPFTKKQRKNPKIQRNKRFTIYLSKRTR